MTVSFNVTGKERKTLAQALSEITFSEVVYAGAPSFDYQVGDYIIDKNGVLSYPDTLSKEAVALVVEKLSERGFAPADEGEAETPEKDAPAETPAEMPDVAAEARRPTRGGGHEGRRRRGNARRGGNTRGGSR